MRGHRIRVLKVEIYFKFPSANRQYLQSHGIQDIHTTAFSKSNFHSSAFFHRLCYQKGKWKIHRIISFTDEDTVFIVQSNKCRGRNKNTITATSSCQRYEDSCVVHSTWAGQIVIWDTALGFTTSAKFRKNCGFSTIQKQKIK